MEQQGRPHTVFPAYCQREPQMPIQSPTAHTHIVKTYNDDRVLVLSRQMGMQALEKMVHYVVDVE
jgi:hypothetical protein